MSVADHTPAIGLTNVRNWVREWSNRLHYRYYQAVEADAASAYERLMDHRVHAHGPSHAVGHYDGDMGMWQFHILRDVFDLAPGDRVLDLGCGTLRAGRYLIPYLDTGNYVGMDISEAALSAGRDRLFAPVVEEKAPELIVNDDLRLDELHHPVDVVWAQSLLTHLPAPAAEELFGGVARTLASDGVAVLTFFDEPQASPKDYGHAPADLRALASDKGLEATVIPESHVDHPKGQRVLRVEVADE
jgi:SAM-dependent methyltransferase